jgi:hypothetical protein
MTLGTAMNFLVIWANGWQMPCRLRWAVLYAKGYIPITRHTKLIYLSDIIVVRGRGGLMALSVGDLLLFQGATLSTALLVPLLAMNW